MTRVLQVVTHMNRGGLETMLMNYYRSIDREQVQFDFLTHRPYDGDYGEEIKRLGGRIFHLPVLNPVSPSYKKALHLFFREHPEYQVVHVHQDCLSGIILKAAQQEHVAVRLAHSHSASQDKNLKYLVKLLLKPMIPKYATGLFACGKDAGEWMFGGAPFQIMSNAIDAKRYRFDAGKRAEMRRLLGIGPDEILVGHVGRFSPTKNHKFLIEIFDAMQKKVPAKLLLVGDNKGDIAKQIALKVENLEIKEKVIFTGVRSDVPDLMQAMDVFVFPSNYEGLPVTLVEAQASSLPCLISEKVPIECKMTDLVQQISLSEGAEVWAKRAIAAARGTIREDTGAQIKAAGFDIAENAKWLQNYYLSVCEKV